MTSLTDSELQARLQALRVSPPGGEFHAQLSKRLREVASAPPARVVPIKKWRTPRRVALLLAAAALPLGAYATTGGWIPGWGPDEPELTESLPKQAPVPESSRRAAARSTGATAPTPPSPEPAPRPATEPTKAAAAGGLGSHAAQRSRPSPPDAQPARAEQRAEAANAGERAPAETRGATERVRIRMNTGSKGSDAAGKQSSTHVRPGRTQASRAAADAARSGVDRRDSQSTADRERERTRQKERERSERSERQSQDRPEKMQHRAR